MEDALFIVFHMWRNNNIGRSSEMTAFAFFNKRETSGAGFTACVVFSSFCTMANYTIAARSWTSCLVQIDNSSDATFAFTH